MKYAFDRHALPNLLHRRVHDRLSHWRNQRLLARACSLVPTILSRIPSQANAPLPTTWGIQHAAWTQTNVAVIAVGPVGQPPSVVLKLPHTKESLASLQRQRNVQATLHADPRLQEWQGLLPKPVAAGEFAGQFYVAEQAMPGRTALSLLTDPAARLRIQTASAAASRELHQRTASSVVVNTAMLERWIDEPLLRIRRVKARLSPTERSEAAIERLRTALYDALGGRTVCVSWIHGDLWPGNMLVDPYGRLLGLVDWDRAEPDGLPLHDVLHLLLITRKLVRQHWGETDIVAALLGGVDWTAHERALLDAATPALPSDMIEEWAMMLLYWLRYTAATLVTLPHFAYNREYVTDNVESVLNAFQHASNASHKKDPFGKSLLAR